MIEVILCATLNTDLTPEWFQLYTKIELLGPDFHVEVMTTKGFLADSARNMAAWTFLTRTQASYLLFIDADNVLPRNVVPRLLAHNKDVVCGLYMMKDRPFPPVMYKYHTRPDENGKGFLYKNILQWERGALFRVDAAGAGCMMISRKCLETIPSPWFSFKEGGTEDTYFCRQAQKHGFEVWMDTSVECGHMRTAMVTVDDYLAQLKNHGVNGLSSMLITMKEAKPWEYMDEKPVEGEFGEVPA